MKTTSAAVLLVLASTLALSGCGGGGGDGEETRSMGGIWRGALTRTENSCPGSTAPQTLNFTHNVIQNEGAIILNDQDGIQFIGSVVGLDGFSVDATGPTGIVAQCSVTQSNRIQYNDIDDDDDPVAGVDMAVTCSGDAGCSIAYIGTASRNAELPTPAPTTGNETPAPVSGGCAAMSTTTASGTYSGDSGCGISEVTYSLNGSTVVLEPLGANGASSFAISDSNSSSATSNNSDLTIQGQSGYSCSLTCSPPLTFTLSCFKEGGTSCVERF